MNVKSPKVVSLVIIFGILSMVSALGFYLKFDKDNWGNTIQIMTLITTVWFTWQLVENDNKRRDDSEYERTLMRLVNFMLSKEGSIAPGINIPYSAAELIDSLDHSEKIVLEAYEELYYMSGLNISKPKDFKPLLDHARKELKAIKKAQSEHGI